METQFASEWEKEKKIFDGLLQIYFEKKTQKTVQQECHDKNLAIITFLCSKSVKRISACWWQRTKS